jgi:hypothetical protein
MQLVIADDVDEVTPANNPARSAQMGRAAGPRRLLQVQFAQLVEIEGRKLLGPRALPLHGGPMPGSPSVYSDREDEHGVAPRPRERYL